MMEYMVTIQILNTVSTIIMAIALVFIAMKMK